jgi:hypothetical protein
VTRRVARVDRKVFESRDVWPVPMDDQRGEAIRRRLDAQDEDDESCNSPSAKKGAAGRSRSSTSTTAARRRCA